MSAKTGKDSESILRSTREVLNDKHPLGKEPDACCLVDGESEPINSIIFDGLDADAIRHAALHTHGAAGPSGLDAYTHGEDSAPRSNLPQIVCVSISPSLVALLPPASTPKD